VPLGIAFMILMLFEYFNPNFHVFFKSDYPWEAIFSGLIVLIFLLLSIIPVVILKNARKYDKLYYLPWLLLFTCYGFGTVASIILFTCKNQMHFINRNAI
jgi:hypothetical protein